MLSSIKIVIYVLVIVWDANRGNRLLVVLDNPGMIWYKWSGRKLYK